ncbi:hypothetical protein CLAFUW4_05109 [Fulvia fulva]|uniref:Uncharacterized protein n=1 Tax=Passalora fulva TaxID=5499 RepID=A0A9Q8PHI2_PASFU|nr:uncharacterized protein CLAFUR5_11797 [Fulvia fulva]KAK4627103.1 hypothetical protein CLAFUR4_05095 [Fulvia fulva]KAK4628089.1 hypothetical protein CLAFUR0_05100 [Fulvia fulva]UJO22573.1 hypothetical protein CLAFUR5_11797 [Fulvia fulva]WPV14208.1 hypothetical protein CLAFUW4_05109 [Fulvia fulva]WPV28178.1 hypothetical protein CLAFUW7_05104 [Fulvia fulva]
MHAFQVLAAIIIGAGAAAIDNEAVSAGPLTDNTVLSLTKKFNPWEELMNNTGKAGPVLFHDSFARDRVLQFNCDHRGKHGEQICCRNENNLVDSENVGIAGFDLCERQGRKRHDKYDVKRHGDYSATYIGEGGKSKKGLLISECHDAMQEIIEVCERPVVGSATKMTTGGFAKMNDWAYTVNIPLDGESPS